VKGITPLDTALAQVRQEQQYQQSDEAKLERRSLSKGQKAMAVAMIYPDADKRGRGQKGVAKTEFSSDFSVKRLAQARSVLRYSRPLADEVITGTTALDEAVKIVRQQELRRERFGLRG
jgi:hypothetical protein